MSELKVGGRWRSVIILWGKAQNGWKVFGLELRKMLELNRYALGGLGQAKFVSTPQRRILGFYPSQSFVETWRVRCSQGLWFSHTILQPRIKGRIWFRRSWWRSSRIGQGSCWQWIWNLQVLRWGIFRWASLVRLWCEKGKRGSSALMWMLI